MAWFKEVVMILWPATKLDPSNVTSPAHQTLPACIAEVHAKLLDKGWESGDKIVGLETAGEWWPIEMCPIEHPYLGSYDACRPILVDDKVYAVLLRMRKR
jgi:hypothetical protein